MSGEMNETYASAPESRMNPFYAGSCGITTVWPKRRRDPDNRMLKGLYTAYKNEKETEIF